MVETASDDVIDKRFPLPAGELQIGIASDLLYCMFAASRVKGSVLEFRTGWKGSSAPLDHHIPLRDAAIKSAALKTGGVVSGPSHSIQREGEARCENC
jgi:hypothetical protein